MGWMMRKLRKRVGKKERKKCHEKIRRIPNRSRKKRKNFEKERGVPRPLLGAHFRMALSLDVRALARAARKKQESSSGGEAAEAARKERERSATIDRANQAARSIAQRVSSSTSSTSTAGENSKFLAVAADVVDGVFYWPEFLTEEEEASLVAAIDLVSEDRWIGGEGSDGRFAACCCCSTTAATVAAAAAATTTTTTATAPPSTATSARPPAPGRRRRANFGGSPSSLESSEELPEFLRSLCSALTLAGAFAREEPANHVLINDYGVGAGLPWHRDGPLYAASATVTLCGSAALELHRIGEGRGDDDDEEEKEREERGEGEKQKSSVQLLLRPRAALSLRGESYERWEHGVPAVAADVVREECANRGAAGVRVGEEIPRSPRRISLVFVNKRRV